MKIEIKKIALENYKCFQNRTAELFHRTEITGRNRAGKSTLMDSFFDVITGKMSDGSQPDNIRMHDENGVEIPKVDVVRELELEIDGKPTVIRKITSQKWRKPRGRTEEVFDGNETSYEIDGFPTKPKAFAEFMENIAKPDILLMCSNANPFLSSLRKSTAEARKILEKLAGFSVEQFISENLQYASVADITKGHSVEDTMKKLRKQLSDQKKKVDQKNTEIKYEKNRTVDAPSVELADLELAKGEWREKLSEVDRQEADLEESVKAYDDLSAEIRKLKSERDEIERKANEEISAEKSKLNQEISELVLKKQTLSGELKNSETDLKRVEVEIQKHKADLQKAKEDYNTYSEREFDETNLHAIKAEQFDESSLICPTCGQAFPSEIEAQKRDLFERSKQERISAELSLKEAFYEEQDRRLEQITEAGNKADEDLKSATERRIITEQKIEQTNKEILSVSAEIEKLTDKLAALPQSVDLSENTEYQSITNQISEKESNLLSLGNGSDQRKELRQKRNECMEEISKIDSQIRKASSDEEEKERKLEQLESELRDASQVAADIEKQIDIVSEFSRNKNQALANIINPHFKHLQFEFLEYTIEGNPVETCKIMVGGTDYMNGLNGGDKRLAELDLCRGLQEMNNLCIPIWMDEAGTVDTWRIPKDLDQQLITIVYEPHENLEIREMNQ